MIELNKAEILSLYALLSFIEIQKVFTECDDYMQLLNEGSLMKSINADVDDEDDQDVALLLGGAADTGADH